MLVVVPTYPGRVALVERAEKNGRGGAVIAAFRRALDDPNGYAAMGEMAYQAWMHGFRIGEAAIHLRDREREASKLALEEVVTAFVNFEPAVPALRYAAAHPRRAGRGRAERRPV